MLPLALLLFSGLYGRQLARRAAHRLSVRSAMLGKTISRNKGRCRQNAAMDCHAQSLADVLDVRQRLRSVSGIVVAKRVVRREF